MPHQILGRAVLPGQEVLLQGQGMNSLDLYQQLFLIRTAEEAIIQHYSEDEMRTPMHMSMGAEALAVGVCSQLQPDDQVLTSYRSHAVFLAKTGNLEHFFAEMYGKATSPQLGRAGSMHLADPEHGHVLATAVVASQIPVALGLAYANKQTKNGRIVVVFFGDGAMDEGVFWESLNLAGLWELPILFVCENNGLSVQTPLEQRSGYPSGRADAVSSSGAMVTVVEFQHQWLDVEWLAKTVQGEILPWVRKNQSCYLEIPYYRFLEHVGINKDFDQGYREDPGPDWPDPVAFQRRRVLEIDRQAALQIECLVRLDVERAIQKARAAPMDYDIYTGVYNHVAV